MRSEVGAICARGFTTRRLMDFFAVLFAEAAVELLDDAVGLVELAPVEPLDAVAATATAPPANNASVSIKLHMGWAFIFSITAGRISGSRRHNINLPANPYRKLYIPKASE
jgi:hypothetical protein